MKKILLSLAIILPLILSCSNDDDQIPTQENTNGFFINSEFKKVKNAYYIPDLTTEENNDFYIVVTDGEIISPLTDSNDFKFTNETTNSVIFRGIQNPNKPEAWNFAPSGTYMLNSDDESFSSAHFNFNCESLNGTLEMCQDSLAINETMVPNIAFIEIEIENLTANYSINYNFELPNSIKIKGQYSGVLDRLETE